MQEEPDSHPSCNGGRVRSSTAKVRGIRRIIATLYRPAYRQDVDSGPVATGTGPFCCSLTGSVATHYRCFGTTVSMQEIVYERQRQRKTKS